MDKTGYRFVVVLLSFVLALIVVRSEGNRRLLQTLFGKKVSWVSQDELDQESVEEMWTHCWKKIDYKSEAIPDFHLNLPFEVMKAINNLAPNAQESLLDCLSRKDLLLDIPNNDAISTSLLEKFVDYLSDFSSVPRRILKSKRQRKQSRDRKKSLHKSQEQKPDDLSGLEKPHKSEKQDSEDLTSNEKLPQQEENHKPNAVDLADRKEQQEEHHKPKADSEKHQEEHHKPKADSKKQQEERHEPKADSEKHQEEHHEPEADSEKHQEEHHNAADGEKHQEEHHKPKSIDSTVSEKHHEEPKPDRLAFHKKHHDPEASTTTHKDPESPKTNSDGTKSQGSAPRPMLQAPPTTPTPGPVPVPPPPEPSTPPPPVPTPPSPDTSPPPPPPSVAKSPPAKDAPDTALVKSENDTHKYMIIAAVAGGLLLLALLALLLVCCLKRGKNKVEPQEGQSNVKSVMKISMSNISGAEEKTQGEETPKEQILNTTVLANNSTSNGEGSPKKSPESPQTQTSAPLPPPPAKKPPPPAAAPPPPPPKKAAPPPPPPKGAKAPPAPLGKSLINKGKKSLGGANNDNGGSDSNNKAKLKPFFWDKVSPDQSMVWQDLKAGSFQVDEEMMESLFGYTVAENTKNSEKKVPTPYNTPPQLVKIIDPKKAQNLSILLKALNVTTEEVCDALKEGNELPSELIQNLLKMAPSNEEELKLRLYSGEITMLGPAERFLKSVVEIPFAFKRLESLLFMSSVQEEVSSINDSFKTLEVACTELKNSRLFLKLLEAVLKTGNRMNDGTYRGDAQAFKLDTLLKLSDVKGTDGKTTLLHFVVQEIIRSEGIRAARKLRESQSMSSLKPEDLNDDNVPDSVEYFRSLGLNVVSNLSSDLENVRKAAMIDGDAVTNAVHKLGSSLGKIKNFLESEMKGMEEKCEFRKKLEDLLMSTEDEVKRLIGEGKRIMDLVKGTVDYFYGKGGKNDGLKLFAIVAEFLVILERVCKEVKNKEKTTQVRAQRREALSPSTSTDSTMSVEQNDVRKKLFPVITASRKDDSDDDSFSP